jgi:hypothetical protein
MIKAAMLALRLPQATKAALEKAAKDDMRPVSGLVEKILTDWLRDKEQSQTGLEAKRASRKGTAK